MLQNHALQTTHCKPRIANHALQTTHCKPRIAPVALCSEQLIMVIIVVVRRSVPKPDACKP
jgi:hypothetical protein